MAIRHKWVKSVSLFNNLGAFYGSFLALTSTEAGGFTSLWFYVWEQPEGPKGSLTAVKKSQEMGLRLSLI